MTFDDWWGAYPTQEDYEANCCDAYQAGAASRNAEIESLRQQLAAMTAERDAYMRDYGEEQDRKREVAQQLASRDAEVAELREQVTMLRDALEFIPESGSMLGHAAEMKRKAALAATEPKP